VLVSILASAKPTAATAASLVQTVILVSILRPAKGFVQLVLLVSIKILQVNQVV
jgi:hypothetical protein